MPSHKSSIRVGTGFSDDRIEPAVDLAERGKLDYLVFECLAERTIARENLTRLKDPERGYTPYLAERFQAVLPDCVKNGVRIVTNMGAANPLGAARAVRSVAKALGIADLPVAVVENRAGAATLIGSELVARAPPDGYLLLMAPGALATNPSTYKKMPFDTVRTANLRNDALHR